MNEFVNSQAIVTTNRNGTGVELKSSVTVFRFISSSELEVFWTLFVCLSSVVNSSIVKTLEAKDLVQTYKEYLSIWNVGWPRIWIILVKKLDH